ncbi:hypothetical protein [Phenylobacterium sp.]|uniref:hypothetical protein n=1 Tax=Phenylobacterium sp. TaxID=1871053 RepID=UPI002FCC742D
MTEEEAQTKWCPKFQVATSGGEVTSTFETDNRPQTWAEVEVGQLLVPVPTGIHHTATCIASACMAWRWRGRQGRTNGYCGFAGEDPQA